MPRWLLVVAVAALLLGLGYAAATPALFAYDARPGAPVGQTIGIVAAALMILSLMYLPAKRSDALSVPNRRLVVVHVTLGVVGAAVALAHSRLVVTQPPILVLLAYLGLLGTGLYGRVVASQRLGPGFGRGGHPFQPGAPAPVELQALARRKRALLARLDPAALEATFTLRLGHFGRRPLRAARYYVLSLVERQRMRALAAAGYRERVGALERLWRLGHLLLAWLAVGGLLAHVATTLFFAQFAAGAGEVYWWHLRK
jgi:hypothetical protein